MVKRAKLIASGSWMHKTGAHLSIGSWLLIHASTLASCTFDAAASPKGATAASANSAMASTSVQSLTAMRLPFSHRRQTPSMSCASTCPRILVTRRKAGKTSLSFHCISVPLHAITDHAASHSPHLICPSHWLSFVSPGCAHLRILVRPGQNYVGLFSPIDNKELK